MNGKPLINDPKLVVVNTTTLAPFDEEKCKYCGRFGCTDRGFTFNYGNPPVVVNEQFYVQNVMDMLNAYIKAGLDKVSAQVFNYSEKQCVRKLKKSNAEAVLETLSACGPDCHRNLDCRSGGAVWPQRGADYTCPYRNEEDSVCLRVIGYDETPMQCLPNDHDNWDCEYHEKAYSHCYRRNNDQCNELMEKFGATGKKDQLLLLNHRCSVAPCRFCEESACANPESPHHEGACTLKGLMAACENYAPLDPDHAYTEGVCAYVSSADGKDDRKIFNSSDYAYELNPTQSETLCTACRIVHFIAKLTEMKCLGVRRSTSNPFLNESNPLADHAIQLNYLYLSNPEDLGKYDPNTIALAEYLALAYDCKALECEEYETCSFVSK